MAWECCCSSLSKFSACKFSDQKLNHIFVVVTLKVWPESNLSRAYQGFLTVNSLEEFHWRCKNKRRNKLKSTISYFTMKMALTQEEEVKQPQTQADQNFSFFLRLLLCLLQHFLLKTEHEAENQRMFLTAGFFFINLPKHSFWVRSWFYQDGRGWRKFEERVSEMVCQFPVTVFIRLSYKELVLSLFLCFFIFPTLISRHLQIMLAFFWAFSDHWAFKHNASIIVAFL